MGDSTNRAVPAGVAASLAFGDVVAGGGQTCGASVSSTAYCWGANSNGELGDGTVSDRPTPTAVTGGLRFTTVSVGYAHSCGLATLVYCWGYNASGQVGDGTYNPTAVPVRVAGQATPK